MKQDESVTIPVEIPSAAEMRAKLNAALGATAQAQIRDLTTAITRATEQGKSGIWVPDFKPGVKLHLEQRGYEVTYYAGDPRDPRESSQQYLVSW